MSFTASIKTKIYEIVKTKSLEFDSEELKTELMENSYSFLYQDEALSNEIIDFVNQPEIKPIADRNLSFSSPSTFSMPNGVVSVRMSLQGAGGDLLDIFEDFILYVLRIMSEIGYKEEVMDEEWKMFEGDFFNDDVDVFFYTQIATFYHHAGGIIEDLIPDNEINIRYLHRDAIKDKVLYHILKKSVSGGSFGSVAPEEFTQNTLPIIIEYKKRIKKTDTLETHFADASSVFDKVTFIIRVISGGSAHYDFIKSTFIGNHAGNNQLFQSFASNHLFANTNSTTLENGPYETWITRLWDGIKTRDMSEWLFVNQKLRDSYSRVSQTDQNYFFDKNYQLARQLERIVDLIQALENVMGDHGTNNSEYMALINGGSDIARQTQIQTDTANLYSLRNKYIHGKTTGTDSVESEYQSNFHNNIDELEGAVDRFEYNLKKIIMISIMNNDLKQRVLDYHRGLGRNYFDPTGRPTRDRNPVAIPFPTFNTIYY